jgi:hypothetical protein
MGTAQKTRTPYKQIICFEDIQERVGYYPEQPITEYIPLERNIMNDHNVEQTTPVAGTISDVKHYAISFDADGNEIRTEIPEAEFNKEFDRPNDEHGG